MARTADDWTMASFALHCKAAVTSEGVGPDIIAALASEVREDNLVAFLCVYCASALIASGPGSSSSGAV